MTYNYVKEARRKRKKLLVDFFGGKCIKCGYSNCVDALDFHHVDPIEKKFAIATSWNSLRKGMHEASKCVIVCATCHRELHAGLWSVDRSSIKNITAEDIDSFIDRYFKRQKNHQIKCQCCDIQIDKLYKNRKFCSHKCASLYRRKYRLGDTKEQEKIELEKLVWEMPIVDIAKMCGVSDKAIHKRIQFFGIQKPPRGYWNKSNNKK